MPPKAKAKSKVKSASLVKKTKAKAKAHPRQSRSRRRRRSRSKPKFALVTKQGKAIEAKLKDIVNLDIMQHRRVPREKLHELLAELAPKSSKQIRQETLKFRPSKEPYKKEAPPVPVVPVLSNNAKNILKLPPSDVVKEVSKETPKVESKAVPSSEVPLFEEIVPAKDEIRKEKINENEDEDDDDEDEDDEEEDDEDDEPPKTSTPKSDTSTPVAAPEKVIVKESGQLMKSTQVTKINDQVWKEKQAAAKTDQVLKSFAAGNINDGKNGAPSVVEMHRLIQEIIQTTRDIEKSRKSTSSIKGKQPSGGEDKKNS